MAPESAITCSYCCSHLPALSQTVTALSQTVPDKFEFSQNKSTTK